MRRSVALLALLALTACRQGAPTEPASRTAPRDDRPAVDGPAVVITTASGQRHVVQVEVARNDATRMRGLMFRRDMADDHGMIFVFRDPTHNTFWMHNTLIPLDMLFLRADRTVLGIVHSATPETDDPRSVPGDSQYVLEVNGGWCRRHNVNANDRVELIGVGPALD